MTRATCRLLILLGFTFLYPATYQKAEAKKPVLLSDSAKISLITGSPGAELYTKFGHSAIRVLDPLLDLDIVFNYGTFDFQTPGFYMKFVRGKLLYALSVYEFERMVREYQRRDQSLYEQDFILTQREKQKIFEFLIYNSLPENRLYLYDFFFDNCSSRIRDVLQNQLPDPLIFTDSTGPGGRSFRILIGDYLHDSPWGNLGIDLILGLPADKNATYLEYMFLPYELMYAFEKAMIMRNGEKTLLCKPLSILYQEIEPGFPVPFLTPAKIFWLLFAILFLLTIHEYRNKKNFTWINNLIFFLTGFAGNFLLFMWFGTDHVATKMNLNILWAFPGHILIPWILRIKKGKKLIIIYLFIFLLLNILLLLGWGVNPQKFNTALIPIHLILIVRGFLVIHQVKISRAYNPIG